MFINDILQAESPVHCHIIGLDIDILVRQVEYLNHWEVNISYPKVFLITSLAMQSRDTLYERFMVHNSQIAILMRQ